MSNFLLRAPGVAPSASDNTNARYSASASSRELAAKHTTCDTMSLSTLILNEQASETAAKASNGKVWLRNDSSLMFTSDGGGDSAVSAISNPTLSNVLTTGNDAEEQVITNVGTRVAFPTISPIVVGVTSIPQTFAVATGTSVGTTDTRIAIGAGASSPTGIPSRSSYRGHMNTVFIGYNATCDSGRSVVIGASANCDPSFTDNTVIGASASLTGTAFRATSIGTSTYNNFGNAVLLGTQAVSSGVETLSINCSGTPTQSLVTAFDKFSATPPSNGPSMVVPGNAVGFLRLVIDGTEYDLPLLTANSS